MATCRAIINSALRKLGVLGGGRDARPTDQTDAFSALQSLYGAWIAGGAFGRLRDVVPTGTNYMAAGNERILRATPDTLTVTLPELVSDQYVYDYGHDRRGYYGTVITITTEGNQTLVDVQTAQPIGYAVPPRDGSVVIISDTIGGETATWLYDASVHRWQGIHLLQLDNEAPRSDADPEGLAALLAIEISDMYGDAATVGPGTLQQAARYRSAMTQRFGMRRECVPGVFV